MIQFKFRRIEHVSVSNNKVPSQKKPKPFALWQRGREHCWFEMGQKEYLNRLLVWFGLPKGWNVLFFCVFLSSLWSNASYWENSAENNFTAPTEGANVVIPSGKIWTKTKEICHIFFLSLFKDPVWTGSYVNTPLSRYLCRTSGAWVVLDSSTPPLNKLTVVGVLEIPDSTNSSSSRTARAAPESSAVVLDAVYISIQVSVTENLSDYPDYHFILLHSSEEERRRKVATLYLSSGGCFQCFNKWQKQLFVMINVSLYLHHQQQQLAVTHVTPN